MPRNKVVLIQSLYKGLIAVKINEEIIYLKLRQKLN